MQVDDRADRPLTGSELTDRLIQLALVGFLVVICSSIFAPFAHVVLWALILAVCLYPLHQALAARMGGRQGASATVIVLVGWLLIGTPSVVLGLKFADEAQGTYTALQEGTLAVRPPGDGVRDWPLIGPRVHAAWSAASADLPQYVQQNREQLSGLARRALATAAGTATSLLLFLGALIVAGIVMAYAEGGTRAMVRITSRFTGPQRAAPLVRLSGATIRSVAMGVLGVAIIQALILGLGLAFADVPFAGLLTLVIVFLGILQLPAVLVTIPAIIWLWSAGDGSATFNTIWTVYLLVGGFSDGVLKPLLLGRGVDAPMPVVLIGALGGMMTAGIIGLFTGAVVLTVAYVLFMEWVNAGVPADPGADSGEEQPQPVG